MAIPPSFAAAADPSLIRCLPMVNKAGHDPWLLTHERVRHTPHVRAVVDFFAARLTALAHATHVAPAAVTP